jgi:hypothetical protein
MFLFAGSEKARVSIEILDKNNKRRLNICASNLYYKK